MGLVAKAVHAALGPAGTGKSHLLLAAGHAAVANGLRLRYFAAADLTESLYRGLADNSVVKIIDNLLRADLIIVDELGFAPLDLAGPSCCSASWPQPTNDAASESPATGRSKPGAGSCPNKPSPPP